MATIMWICVTIAYWLFCAIAGHDWHYFSLVKASDSQREYFRCCMRCEKSQQIDKDAFVDGKESDKW